MFKPFGRKCCCVILAAWGMLFSALPAGAENTRQDVTSRMARLERDNAALRMDVAMLKDERVKSAQAVAAAVALSAYPPAPTAPAGNFLKTKLDMDLYGYIKADAVFATSDPAASAAANSSVSATNAPRATWGHQRSFNISGQDTRLGLNMKAPDMDNGGKLSGKFEMDLFANSGATYQPRLRLAYGQVEYKKWAVTAGQTWDFFAPLNPSILNPGALFRGGNLGARHPQVYLTNRWGHAAGGEVTTKVGVIDSDDPLQENSGVPVGGAYVDYVSKILGRSATFGLGGIWGRNSTGYLNSHSTKNNNIYAVTAGVTVQVTDQVAFKAEGFSGAKLDDFMGGSPTGISNTTFLAASKPIRVRGGFMELCFVPFKKIETSAGVGLDDVNDNTTIPNLADRQAIWGLNRTYYANLKYNLSKDMLVGLEYQQFTTHWLDGVTNISNRIQTSLIYKF